MSAATPIVSVIIPAYRAAAHVADAVAAVRASSFEDFELIVVDDASDDGTAEAARRACGDDPRCRVLERSANGGSTAARRSGIEAAIGTYVWQVDVDDQWSSEALGRFVEAARMTEADVVVARARRVERNGRTAVMEGVDQTTVVEHAGLARLVLEGTLRGYLWNKLFRRDLLDTTDRPALTSQDDHLVVLSALERTRRVTLIPDVLYTYHDTPGSISDSAMLQLDNVAVTWDATVAWADRVGPSPAPQDLVDFFTVWYLLVPVLTTPVHQGWPADRVRSVRRRFAPQLTWAMVRTTCRRDRRRGLHAAGLKMLGPAFGPVYRVIGRMVGFSIR
jgi:glycosyltransferase involved in cell wall biosynthesis